MKLYKYILLFVLSFLTAILDTSFFSFLTLYEASLISTFSIMIILMILDLRREALYFASFSILFYTIFSSVPVYLLFILFLGIPLFFYLLKTRVAINLESLVWVIIILFLSNLLFDLLLIVFFGDVSAGSLTSLLFFTIINTVFGLIVFYISKIIIKYFNIQIKTN